MRHYGWLPVITDILTKRENLITDPAYNEFSHAFAAFLCNLTFDGKTQWGLVSNPL